MLEIKVTTMKKAKVLIQKERVKSRKHKKKSPIMQEYEEYLKKLERGKAIAVTLKEHDKFQTIKYRLNNAAKSLGIKNLKIERAGNKVIFYKEVRPRTRKTEQLKVEVWPERDESRQEQYLFESEPEPEPALPNAPATPSMFAPAQHLIDTPPPVTTPRQEDAALVFDEEWEQPMVYGQKTCEARVEKYAGNTFESFGHQYVITKVEQLPLGDIAEKWFKEHGFFNPREFREVWKQQHGGVFDPEQKAWLHHFRRGFPPPVEPDSSEYPEENAI